MHDRPKPGLRSGTSGWLLLAVLLIFAGWGQDRLFHMGLRKALALGGQALGGRLQAEQVSGNLLGQVRLQGLRLEDLDLDGLRANGRIAHLKLDFHPLRLLGGRRAFLGSSRIFVDRPDLQFRTVPGTGPAPSPAPPPSFILDILALQLGIRDAKVLWHPAAGELMIRFQAQSDGRRLRVTDLKALAFQGRVRVAQAELPVRAWFTPGEDPWQQVSVRGDLALPDAVSWLVLVGLLPATDRLPLQAPMSLSAQWRLERLALWVDRLVLEAAGGTVTASGLIWPHVDLSRLTQWRPAQGHLQADIRDLSSMGAAVGNTDWQGRVSLQADFASGSTEQEGAVTLTARDLVWKRKSIGDLLLSGRVGAHGVILERLDLRHPKHTVQGQGGFDWAAGTLQDVRLTGELRAGSPLLDVLLPGADLQGRAVLNMEARGPWRLPEGRLHLEVPHLTYGAFGPGDLMLQAEGLPGRVRLENLSFTGPGPELRLSGVLSHDDGDGAYRMDIKTAAWSHAGGNLSLISPARATWQPSGKWSLTPLELAGTGGRIALTARAEAPGQGSFDLEARDLSSGSWFASLTGKRLHFSGLNVRAAAAYSPGVTTGTLQGKIAELSGPAAPFAGSLVFDISQEPNRLSLRSLTFTAKNAQPSLVLSGFVSANLFSASFPTDADWDLQGHVNLPDLHFLSAWMEPGWTLTGTARADFHLTGTPGVPKGRVTVAAFNLELPSQFPLHLPGPITITAQARAEGARLTLESFSLTSPALQADAQGFWHQPAWWHRWLALRGRAADAVDVTLAFASSDIGWVGRSVARRMHIGGRLEGKLRVRGPMRNPVVQGEARLEDGRLRWENPAAPALEDLKLKVIADQHKLTLAELTATLGGARLTGSGQADLSGESPYLRVKLGGDNLLLWRSEYLRVRAEVLLQLAGVWDRLALTGKVRITEGRYTQPIDWLAPLRGSAPARTGDWLGALALKEPPGSGLRYHVAITAGPPFVIRNNMAKAAVRPELTLTGTGELPALDGEVYIDDSQVNLPFGRMNISSGVVSFDAQRPGQAHINLNASGQVRGYQIGAQVQGPLLDPSVFLSSVPPLPKDALLVLVLTGSLPKDLAQGEKRFQAQLNLAIFLGQDLIDRLTARTTGGVADVVDRFQVDVGRDLTQSGQETISAQFQMSEGWPTRGDILYLTSERDMYGDYNAGIKLAFPVR